MSFDTTPKQTWSADVRDWQQETFGVTTLQRAYERCIEELGELSRAVRGGKLDKAKAAEECADVCIVMCAVCAELGFDLAAQIQAKMAINRKRKWRLTGDGCGYHEGE